MNLLQMILLDVNPEAVDFTKGWIVTIAGFLIVIIALLLFIDNRAGRGLDE